MAWMYVELFRKGDQANLVGHLVRIFEDGVVPPVPDDRSRMVRIEVTNRTAVQVRNFLDQGIGRFKLNNLTTAAQTTLRNTRTLSGTAGQLATLLGVDRDPAALPVGTRKMRLKMDLPNKPNGAWFIKEPGSNVYTCLTDPNTWFDANMVESAALPVPVKPTAAQGLDFEEIP